VVTTGNTMGSGNYALDKQELSRIKRSLERYISGVERSASSNGRTSLFLQEKNKWKNV
jgi:hypothetical protein